MWDLLYKSVNDAGVKATYQKSGGQADVGKLKAEWGVCAGMSAIFLQKFVTGKDTQSAPDTAAAAILYAKWANRQDEQGLTSEQFNESVLSNAGLQVEEARSFSGSSGVLHMQTNAGNYYISTGNHAMAAVFNKAFYYFFDPNVGCKRTNSSGDFEDVKGFVEAYAGAGYNPNWRIYKVGK